MVGGITFYLERGAFGLITSQCPIIPYLLQEDKTRVTRVVRVLRVDTNKNRSPMHGLGQHTMLDPTVGPDVTINLGNRVAKIRKSNIFALLYRHRI
jgi:hypothetical protein